MKATGAHDRHGCDTQECTSTHEASSAFSCDDEVRRSRPRLVSALRHEAHVAVPLKVPIGEIEGVRDVPEVHVPRAVRHPDPREAVVRVALLVRKEEIVA